MEGERRTKQNDNDACKIENRELGHQRIAILSGMFSRLPRRRK